MGFGGETEGETPLGRPRNRWEDKIKMDLKELGWERFGCINLAVDRDRWRGVMKTVTSVRVAQSADNFLTS